VRIALGSDHAGFRLKALLVDHLAAAGHAVADLGTDSEATVDYPAFCAAVGRAVVEDRADVGIVLGGSGQGEAMAANKVRGVRAALCRDELTARLARQHNDANVLSLGGRLTTELVATGVVEAFLTTPFEGGRHVPRLEQLRRIEDEECSG
jgi:ribose 5-phosphate isomerase B